MCVCNRQSDGQLWEGQRLICRIFRVGNRALPSYEAGVYHVIEHVATSKTHVRFPLPIAGTWHLLELRGWPISVLALCSNLRRALDGVLPTRKAN